MRMRLTLRAGVGVITLAIAALCAVQGQLDMAARQTGRYDQWILAPFRSASLARQAREAITEGQGALALAKSQALVRSSPVPQENLSLLAQAALANGDQALAVQALQIGAARGWRDSFVQAAVIDAALQAGQWQIAAQRIDALQRIGVAADLLLPSVKLLTDTAAGRAALEAQLATSPGWVHRALTQDGWLDLPGMAVAVGNLARHSPGSVSCTDLARASNAALNRGRLQLVDAVWPARCIGSEGDGRSLSGFAVQTTDGQTRPFGWQYPAEPGLERTFRTRGNSVTIDFENRDPFQHVLAQKVLRLRPHATVTARITGNASPTNSGITLKVECQNGQGASQLLVQGALSQQPVTLRVPAAGCAMQRITLLVGPNATARDFALLPG